VGRDRQRVANQKKTPGATDHGSRPKKKFRSRPTTGRDPDKKSDRDRTRVATQKKNPIATEVCGRDPVEKIFSFFFSNRKILHEYF
jgi:hypothetical protein